MEALFTKREENGSGDLQQKKRMVNGSSELKPGKKYFLTI